MFPRNRYRRGPYALAEPAGVPSIVKLLIWLIVLGVISFYLLRWIFNLLGGGGEMQRKAVQVAVENGSVVNVSIEGGLMKRADTGIPLYNGDKVTTGTKGHATLSLFDGTKGRMDETTDVTVTESVMGAKASTITLRVDQGGLWIQTPSLQTFSGSITRTIITPGMTITVPAHSEALITNGAIAVFSADGLGLSVQVKGAKQVVMIGEGQKFALPSGANAAGDLYQYRNALDASSVTAFVRESRGQAAPIATGSGSNASMAAILNVTAPLDDAHVASASVAVQGTVGKNVAKVRINDVAVDFDKASGTFSQSIVMDENDFNVTVDALDAQDIVLSTVHRVVHRQSTSAVKAPVITEPAKNGETFRTTEREVVLRGTNVTNATGIMVNDYRLQLFTPGKGTWSYLASAALKNLKVGTNIFKVYSLDAKENKSDPATVTVIYDDGTLPAQTTSAGSAASSSVSSVSEISLPQNDPLNPGTLKVTGPTAGMTHTATGSEFVIEGTTASSTASIWINGYKLQLYKAGKTTWNYIASTAFGNLKKGTNTYMIVARDNANRIIDKMTYTVTY